MFRESFHALRCAILGAIVLTACATDAPDENLTFTDSLAAEPNVPDLTELSDGTPYGLPSCGQISDALDRFDAAGQRGIDRLLLQLRELASPVIRCSPAVPAAGTFSTLFFAAPGQYEQSVDICKAFPPSCPQPASSEE